MNPSISFPIDHSYINLAMIETKEQQEKEKKLRDVQHSETIISTFEEIYGTKTVIEVKNMFDKCKDPMKKVLVLGRAGIGKSTFCRYVACRWAKGEIWQQYHMVALIPLRSLTAERYPPPSYDKTYSLVDLLQDEYFRYDVRSDEDRELFQEQCRDGRILWLLDGYDEFVQNIPAQLKDLFEHLCETQHHILTSRPYTINLSYTVQMEITGFTDDNIKQYVTNFFEHSSLQAQNVINFLKTNPNVWGVAHIPVNLELICTSWTDPNWSQTETTTITILYSKMIQLFCRRYLQKRGTSIENMHDIELHKECEDELAFLGQVAFEGMQRNAVLLPPSITNKSLAGKKFTAPQICRLSSDGRTEEIRR